VGSKDRLEKLALSFIVNTAQILSLVRARSWYKFNGRNIIILWGRTTDR